MKRNAIVTVLVFVIVSFISCSKSNIVSPTQGELTTNELKKVINDNSILRVYPVKYHEVFPNTFPAAGGTSWSFSNGFVYFNYNTIIQNYNLSYLVAYSISNINLDNGTVTNALILYFE